MINNSILDDRFKNCVNYAEQIIAKLKVPANLNVHYIYCEGH